MRFAGLSGSHPLLYLSLALMSDVSLPVSVFFFFARAPTEFEHNKLKFV